MKVARGIAEARAGRADIGDVRVALVPTMGALHEGHMSLVRAAIDDADFVIVSIFVNPLQFGANEDLETYPRDEERDLELLDDAGVALAFLPSVDEMYPRDRTTTIEVGAVGRVLEGASRPGHFAGVATVVAKLFGIATPDVAFFGQKDAQQLAVVRRMVADLSIPVEIRSCPTVREPDGLAMSSRNVFLSPAERTRALALSRALEAGGSTLREEGEVGAAEKAMAEEMRAEAIEPDYAVVVHPDLLTPFDGGGPALLAVAARVGPVRLIDNVLIEDL